MARVLVIDDDPLVRAMLKQTLEKSGYEVADASDGAEGIGLFRQKPADVVITDIIMPGKDGWETIVELRRDFPDVKIIAISGGDRIGPTSYLMIGRRFGAQRIFAKPLKKDELLKAVSELLRGAERRARRETAQETKVAKKSILVVESDPGVTRSLFLALGRAGHTVTDTSKAEYALNILKKRRFDAVVVDIQGQESYYQELIDDLDRDWTNPIIVGAADFSMLAETPISVYRGATHYVDKPIDMQRLLDLISPPEDAGEPAQGCDILDFLHNLLLTEKVCALTIVSTEGRSCKLFLEGANIVHAVAGNVAGEDAFYMGLNFPGGVMTIGPRDKPPARTIAKSGDELLMEAARQMDQG